MKIFSMIFMITMIATPSLGFAEDIHLAMDDPTRTGSLKEWSAADHRAAAKNQKEKAEKLMAKIERLVNQYSELTQRPYLDPKSLRRDSLRRTTGYLMGELRTVQTQIAWHHKEANHLTAMNGKPLGGG